MVPGMQKRKERCGSYDALRRKIADAGGTSELGT